MDKWLTHEVGGLPFLLASVVVDPPLSRSRNSIIFSVLSLFFSLSCFAVYVHHLVFSLSPLFLC